MSIQASKINPKVGEPIELTITARYLNLHPSLLLTFQGSNAFRIKMVVPDGFVVTGGTYQDYIGDNLTPDHPYVSYTIRGYFTKIPVQSQFRLLRGGADANEQSIFVLKSQLTLQVKPSNASMARSGCTVVSPEGSFDFISCSRMYGWAFDRADLSQTLQVDVYVDGILTYPGLIANVSRPDLVDAFGTQAARLHGYYYSFPANAAWRDGKSHTFTVRLCGATNDLDGSPKTIDGCTGVCIPPQAPVLSASDGNLLCKGSVTLTASGCSGTVNWSTGVTSNSISVSSAATYTATCTQNNCTSPANTITVSNCANQGGGGSGLVSGSCYTIKSQQNANLLQAASTTTLFMPANSQTNQIWLADSVASNTYKFTVQDGSRQVLYVDALNSGQAMRLGAYQADPRYQWTLEKSNSGGYRVYGGSNQITWDYQAAGGGTYLQLYGSNKDQTDEYWNQAYRRFNFGSVSCPNSATTTPGSTTTTTPGSTTTSPGSTTTTPGSTTTTPGSTTTSPGSSTVSTLIVNPSSVSVGAGASSQVISVTSNTAWSVNTNGNAWLSVSGSSGNGGFSLSIAANSGQQRTGTVSVGLSGGGQTQTITVTQAAGSSGGGGGSNLVSGSCYTIQSQQNTNLVQAVGGAARLQAANSQTNQIWLADTVASNAYKFTVQDGSRQALYVDALSNGQPLKLNTYQADPRYQWTLERSSSGGYRVYGGSNQITWDYQGGGNALQLYGSNQSQSDGSWNQSYRRFSFNSVSCPTSTTTTPSSVTTTPGSTTTATSSTTATTLSVSPSSVNAGPGASNQVITVSSNVAWSVSSEGGAWLTVSSTSGSGNGDFTVSIAANNGQQRTGIVRVSGGDQTQTIAITQAAGVSGGCNLTTTPLAGAFNYTPFAPSSIPGNYVVTQENGTVKLELNLKEGSGANNGLAGGILGIWDKLHAGGPQNAISNPVFSPGNCGDCGFPTGTFDVGSGNQIALYRLPRNWNLNGVILPNGDNPTEYGGQNMITSKLNQYGRSTINGVTADYTSIDPAQWEGSGQMLTGDKFEKWISVQGNEIKIWYQETLSRTAQTGANYEQSYPRNQEAPCLYANANLYRTVFYDGDAPYTNGQVRSMQLDNNIGLLNGQNYLTENWVALIGEDGRGIGLIMETPITHIGQLGSTANNLAGTGFGRRYIGWHPKMTLDPNIVWRHSVVEVIGTLAEIRQAAYNYTQSRYSPTPEYRFNRAGRQLWSIENCTDPGYVASRNSWPITFKTNGANITSPAAAWSGANKKVYMRYRYTANGRSQATVNMKWRRARQSDAFPPSTQSERNLWNQQFPDGSAVGPDYIKSATLNANGQWNVAEWDMTNMAEWKGIISEIIFKSDDNSVNDTLEIEWISGSPVGPCVAQ